MKEEWCNMQFVVFVICYISDFGYRIVKESLFKVGPSAPGSAIRTLGGEIQLGFEAWLHVLFSFEIIIGGSFWIFLVLYQLLCFICFTE